MLPCWGLWPAAALLDVRGRGPLGALLLLLSLAMGVGVVVSGLRHSCHGLRRPATASRSVRTWPSRGVALLRSASPPSLLDDGSWRGPVGAPPLTRSPTVRCWSSPLSMRVGIALSGPLASSCASRCAWALPCRSLWPAAVFLDVRGRGPLGAPPSRALLLLLPSLSMRVVVALSGPHRSHGVRPCAAGRPPSLMRVGVALSGLRRSRRYGLCAAAALY